MSIPLATDTLFRSFFELAPDLMCIMSTDGRLEQVSHAVETLGYNADDLVSLPLLELVHPDDRAETGVGLAAVARGTPLVAYENRCRCKDGSHRWLSWNARAVPSGRIFAVARDVTEAKHAEASLQEVQEANQFLDAIVENIPNMVFVKEAERLAFVRFNRAGEELLGVPRADLFGKNDYDFFPAEEAAFFQKKDRETLNAGQLVEIAEEPIQTARGMRILRTKKVPILDRLGTPRYLLGISEDITEYKAGEEARARLASIVTDSADAIIGRTLEGAITSWNRSAERMFGYDAEEMLGNPISILFPARLAEEERFITEKCRRGERVEPYETVRRCKDGREIEVSVATSPVLDSSGHTIGVSKIVRDITELKRTQRQLLRAKEATEAANRELDAFSHSVAHDLRAPLRSIDGFSHAVLEDQGHLLDAQGQKYLGFVRDAAQTMAQLIDDMLILSRVTRSEIQRETIDLSELARNTLERLQHDEPERRVHTIVKQGLVADGDARLLAIAFNNLLGNAWKFTSKRAEGQIEFGSTSTSDAVTYFVRDNGAGFDMNYANKLFRVFERLHTVSEFEGTGVGLATVQRVIGRHGGRVWAEGRVDAGATFYFTLGDME